MGTKRNWLRALGLASGAGMALAAWSEVAHADEPAAGAIIVTVKRAALLGAATTASEGLVDDTELQLTPAYRPGQLLETVPGLIATLHSGEGKANQYLMRGYNLDHGTDLATTIDGMPINQPTHAHGQGYTDLNFLIPELADALTYTKGPYYGNVGDFGAVGSVHIALRDTIRDQLSVGAGSYGYQHILAAGSQGAGDGHILEAVEVQHYDGPFATPDDARKQNALLRYSNGDVSLTASFYHQDWTNTTDVPLRAVAQGLVASRFGSLDPTDGGHAYRGSLSGQYKGDLGAGKITASAYAIYNQLHIFNNFTHFLVDPVHGDQEDQFEYRQVLGGAVSFMRPFTWGGFNNALVVGGLLRYDHINLGRLPSQGQQPLAQAETGAPASFSNHDHVALYAGAIYVQLTTYWTDSLRSVLALRDDTQYGRDKDLLATLHQTAGYTNGGARGQSLAQPKASLIYRPAANLEVYAAAGQGFHSADLRGVNQDRSVDLGLPYTPLLARQVGEELGLRAAVGKRMAFTLAVYNLWQRSETIINPDVGVDVAGPPSRRYGFEVNVTYQISKWLEFYGSYSGNHTRFTSPFDDGTGHLGKYITDAPDFTGSAALYLKGPGRWSGGLNLRYLGNYALSSGPCVNSAALHDFGLPCPAAPTAMGQVTSRGFAQVNMDAHFAVNPKWTLSLGLYNALNTHAAAAEFWYVDRLKSEVAQYPNGVADIHAHPLEPRMVRICIAKIF